ncbi:MAG: hypothetical protein GVY29_13120 [Spirochaetes bacterium]|jgi:menaquinone-dependent protoporphyrinogen oxidase|nr:hypothetical protein [Spirochaetota bacterium]
MRTLIAFAGRKGTAREMAQRIAGHFPTDTQVVDVKRESPPDPREFDRVILGGSILASQMPAKLRKYAAQYSAELQQKPHGLFVSCLQEGEAENYLNANFGADLVESASATAWLGGRLVMREHNPLVRGMLKKVMGTTTDMVNMRYEEADRFAAAMCAADGVEVGT